MRVDNGAIGGTASSLYTQDTTKTAQSFRSSSSTWTAGSDRSYLSNTGELVGLAKTLTSRDYMNKLQTISSDVGSGRYQPDPTAVSQALVHEHLNGQEQ